MFSKLQGMVGNKGKANGNEGNDVGNKGKANGNEGNDVGNKGKANGNEGNEGNGNKGKANGNEGNGNNENGVLIVPEMSQENLNKSNSGENIDVLIAGQEGQISPCTIS